MRCQRVRCECCRRLDYIDKMKVAFIRPVNGHDKRFRREAYRHIEPCPLTMSEADYKRITPRATAQAQ